jgi:hypothetical protein
MFLPTSPSLCLLKVSSLLSASPYWWMTAGSSEKVKSTAEVLWRRQRKKKVEVLSHRSKKQRQK